MTHEEALNHFDDQINYVIQNYENQNLNLPEYDNIILCGLGGSGIASQLAKHFYKSTSPIPIDTIADYNLPAYASEKSLVILNSYSGNTEETLSMANDAFDKKCNIIALSSGGQLTSICQEKGVKCFPLKGGFQPRQSIGLSLSYLFLILGDLFQKSALEDLQEYAKSFQERKEKLLFAANDIYRFFISNISEKFVILADGETQAIATRFANQIQENDKLEAFVNVLPEHNHNVIETYIKKVPTNFLLLYTATNPRVEARFDFVSAHLEMDNNKVLPVIIPKLDIKRLYDIIYRLDWVSVLIANEIGSASLDVPVITQLKDYLSNIEIVDEGEE